MANQASTQRCDHRTVVRAKLWTGHPQHESGTIGTLLHQSPKPRVCRHSTTEHQVVDSAIATCIDRFASQRISDGLLEARGDICDLLGCRLGVDRRHQSSHRRLEPGEGEIEPMVGVVHHRPRQFVCSWISRSRGPIDVWSTGKRQPEQPCNLVERFTSSVIQRLTERLDAVAVENNQRRVATGNQERHHRIRKSTVFEFIDRYVRR